MEINTNVIIKRLLLAVLMSANVVVVNAQNGESKAADCVSLRVIEQKPAPKIKEKPAPDLFVETPDDILLRFELKNNCKQPVHYLAYNLRDYNTAPAGFMIYRDSNKDEWKARSPAWRRERSLTGVTYHWIPIKPDASLEFEFSDLSLIAGERSVAIYVNTTPCHENRVEIVGKPFTLSKS